MEKSPARKAADKRYADSPRGQAKNRERQRRWRQRQKQQKPSK